MGLLTWLRELRGHPSKGDPVLNKMLSGGADVLSGVDVTPDSAMQCTAVFACVNLLARTISTLPAFVHRRVGDTTERAVDHPAYAVIHDTPNPEMTSVEWRETMQGHLALRGNAFSEIEYGRNGKVKYLWPWHPDAVRMDRVKPGVVSYQFKTVDGSTMLPARRVLHLRRGGGLWGTSPIEQSAEAVGLSLATEKYGAAFFGNNAAPGGVLTTPGVLGKEARENLEASWKNQHADMSNKHRTAVLEDGLTWQSIGIPPEHAQFLETRRFQISEIARIFGVPPHMIQDLSHATFSNIEHQSIDFVTHSIRPWLVLWEQRLNMSLLSSLERKDYFFEFLVDGLLRGDSKTRYDGYSVLIQNGVLSPNEARGFENWNPREGGDVYLTPLNMSAGDEPVDDNEPQGVVPDGDGDTQDA